MCQARLMHHNDANMMSLAGRSTDLGTMPSCDSRCLITAAAINNNYLWLGGA
jgi:hypothetical protein